MEVQKNQNCVSQLVYKGEIVKQNESLLFIPRPLKKQWLKSYSYVSSFHQPPWVESLIILVWTGHRCIWICWLPRSWSTFRERLLCQSVSFWGWVLLLGLLTIISKCGTRKEGWSFTSVICRQPFHWNRRNLRHSSWAIPGCVSRRWCSHSHCFATFWTC